MALSENISDQALLQSYLPLASFIAKAIGGNAEVVIHDLNKLENSIIFIENGHLSNRRVGDGSTDFVLKTISDNRYETEPFVSNYRAKAINDNQFKSSTYFIKNPTGKLIGLMCININITHLHSASQWLTEFLDNNELLVPAATAQKPAGTRQDAKFQENLQGNSETTLEAIIYNTINKKGIDPCRLNTDEKQQIIKQLSDEGVFLMKGGVRLTAQLLELSEPTVYRYLKKIKISVAH